MSLFDWFYWNISLMVILTLEKRDLYSEDINAVVCFLLPLSFWMNYIILKIIQKEFYTSTSRSVMWIF